MIPLGDFVARFVPVRQWQFYIGRMGDNNRSSVRSREFGTEVKRFRERVDLNAAKLAANLRVAGSTISRLERGDQHVMDGTNLSALLTVCGLRGNQLKEFLAKGMMDDNGYYLAPNGDKIPDGLLAVIIHEEAATAIRNYSALFVPGLLQTEGYMRALFHGGGLTEEQTERGVRNRISRQKILSRRYIARPHLTFFINETALLGRVGDDQVMSEQITYLLMLSAEDRVTIRVLPTSQHAAGPMSAFQLMTFAKFGPVVSADVPTAVAFFEQPTDIQGFQEELNRLDQAALSAQESKDTLYSLNEAYSMP